MKTKRQDKARESFQIFGESGEVQPIPAGLDHFAFLGLPRRMRLDEKELEKRYYALSKKLHPDYHQGETASVRIRILDASARLNEAYKILKDPLRRAVYLVELESGKMAENDTAPPLELMEEILEAQEAVAELKCCDGEEDAAQQLRNRLKAARECFEVLRAGQWATLEALSGKWDAAAAAEISPSDEIIDKMRSVLGQRNYINNVLRSIEDALLVAL
ncbi:MAG: Fe-S protein assembly co-chaperone HscB [bacterium]|nr:Fe-S protein assembly co-chaperone HscB [bacterium]